MDGQLVKVFVSFDTKIRKGQAHIFMYGQRYDIPAKGQICLNLPAGFHSYEAYVSRGNGVLEAISSPYSRLLDTEYYYPEMKVVVHMDKNDARVKSPTTF